jgi:transcriptional regulator of acetoin/glycerol metabolism
VSSITGMGTEFEPLKAPRPTKAGAKRSIRAALAKTGGHVGAAAILLGVSSTTLQRTMRKRGFPPQRRGAKPAKKERTR